jgi:hypothetical protein
VLRLAQAWQCCTVASLRSLIPRPTSTHDRATPLTGQSTARHRTTLSINLFRYTASSNHSTNPSHSIPMPDVKLVVTGFSTFCGVDANPTEELVNWLDQLPEESFQKGV